MAGVDGRSTWVRRLRDLIALHLSDLGGEDAVSEAERSIVRRVATLTVELERMESVFAVAGEARPDQIDLYQRTANSLRRLLESVGLERRQRTVSFEDEVARLMRERPLAPPDDENEVPYVDDDAGTTAVDDEPADGAQDEPAGGSP